MDNPLIQPDPGLFIWTIITFLVLLALLARFAWKPLLTMLAKREETIRKSLEEAERARQELERLQSESEAIIAQARHEAQSIIAESKVLANRMREELLQKARDQAERVLKESEKQIQAQQDKAISEVRKEVVNLSLAIAAKLIGKKITTEDDKALIEDSIRQVEQYEA